MQTKKLENQAIVDNVAQWIILTRQLIIGTCSYKQQQSDEGLCINNYSIIQCNS